MKRFSLIAALLLFSLSFVASAQMTDDQVVNYVKTAVAAGKSQEQIGRELLLRGVTQEQAERVRAKYEAAQSQETSVTEQALVQGSIQRESREEALSNGDGFTDAMAAQAPDPEEGVGIKIYGHDIFRNPALTFEPNENAATPQDYRLGPGDQLVIDIWGYSEGSYTRTISPEGRINISQIGPIQVGGLTIAAASEKIRKALISKYSSLGGSNPNTSVSVTLGQIRTILVNVMGEVRTAGTYRLSSFSSVFHALYRAGGVTARGSLRAIKVVRGGKEVANVDIYEYLMAGKAETDIALREGDVIIVPPYVGLATVSGGVKRPMAYEILGNETLETLIGYAGGLTNDSYKEEFRVVRQTGPEREVYNVKASAARDFVLADGDNVSVGANLDRFSNKVEVRGYVFRPGMYELGKEIATVRQLVSGAGGLKEDAFTGRAFILREKDDLSLETVTLDLAGVLSGQVDDILLRKNDILVISGIHEIKDRGTLTINGLVASPGVYPFADNTTIEDLILEAGGLLEGASMARVDVSRRVVDPRSLQPTDVIGEMFSFELKDGLALTDSEFTLEPYDIVSVRRSPGSRRQSFVIVSGEVAFPGSYVLLTVGERLSDVINRAGGATGHAYLRGATLTRVMNEEERKVQQATLRLAKNANEQEGEIDLSDVVLSDTYSVGIELDKALARPGSEYDVILREGDRLFVPEMLSTVRVSGNVVYPNTVMYVPGKPLSYYIEAAGGYGFRAARNKTTIVYMNGTSKRATLGAKIEPGCEIIVREKPKRREVSTGEVVSVATSATSLATMVVTLISMISRNSK